MYKIAILGCENSHADTFLDFILKEMRYTDVEVIGVYSEDTEAAKKLNEKYGVYTAQSYDEFVGKADGILITARHGGNHLKYAKPYIKSGIPMFIDKPVTVSEEEARDSKDSTENDSEDCAYGSLSDGAHRDGLDGVKGNLVVGSRDVRVNLVNDTLVRYDERLLELTGRTLLSSIVPVLDDLFAICKCHGKKFLSK